MLAIVGPTASSKSALAVEIALRYNGEIISADSRQVYRGLDIGSGKITEGEMRGLRHHLLDVADPQKTFTVDDYKKLAELAIDGAFGRGKLPILVGGTGFYVQAVIDGLDFPKVSPDENLRRELEGKTDEELLFMLQERDPKRARDIDFHNRRRLIRAIEIAEALGKVPPVVSNPKYQTLMIGIEENDEILKKKIRDRLEERLERGMIEEVEHLQKKGLPFERLEQLGLEYRYVGRFLQGKIDRGELFAVLEKEIWLYAKRQRTWFRRDKRITWHKASELTAVFLKVEAFLNN
ncbi:MAG: tRNA (adenosine(37)-N6)-dimethylallyltransferase MiaA [bacterium]|nr:tRNA (adenosine(37)-N6)-dimethylallyltransferase MiaA [bacterium]